MQQPASKKTARKTARKTTSKRSPAKTVDELLRQKNRLESLDISQLTTKERGGLALFIELLRYLLLALGVSGASALHLPPAPPPDATDMVVRKAAKKVARKVAKKTARKVAKKVPTKSA